MRNPIENLGDYNDVRIDLQEAGGSKDALYQAIKDAGATEAAPRNMALGAFLMACGLAIYKGGKLMFGYLKKRKQVIENELALKTKFSDMLETQSTIENGIENDEEG